MVEKNDSITRLNSRDGEKGSEDSLAFTLRKPIDMATFGQEIVEEFGLEALPGMISEGQPRRASAKYPVVIWIMSPDLDGNKIKAIVNKHEPPTMTEMEKLVKKAHTGDDFTDEEIQKALRLLLISRR